MRIKDPEKPGNVIPETLIIPQKKTKRRLSFSFAGSKKLTLRPKMMPMERDSTVL